MNNLAFVVPIHSRGGGGRGTQVVMDGLIYYPFYFVEKIIILNTLGRIARSYEFYAGKEIFLVSPRYLL